MKLPQLITYITKYLVYEVFWYFCAWICKLVVLIECMVVWVKDQNRDLSQKWTPKYVFKNLEIRDVKYNPTDLLNDGI